MVSLLGECHEPGSEGTELMGNIAGARLERGCSTDEARMVAQLGRGWWHRRSAVRTRLERSRSEVSSVAGAQLVAQTERGGSAVRARTERGWGAVRAQSERGQCAVRAGSVRS